MRHWALLGALATLNGCAALDQIRLGSSSSTYDPTKIYIKSDFFRVERREDLDRIVCLTGPLQCRAWGFEWSCVCP